MKISGGKLLSKAFKWAVLTCTASIAAALAQSPTSSELIFNANDSAAAAAQGLGSNQGGSSLLSVRAEIAKAIQAADALMAEKKPKLAMAQMQQAAALPKLTGQERYVIEYNLAAAALAAGEHAQAIRSLEFLVQSAELQKPQDRQTLLENLVLSSAATKDHTRVNQWAPQYRQAGGAGRSAMLAWLAALNHLGQHQQAVGVWQELFQADQRAGVKPAEVHLQMYAYSQLQLKNQQAYMAALQSLVTHYPSRAYWRDLISRIEGQADFDDRYALDLYMLMLMTQTFEEAAELLDFAQLALKAGLPKMSLQALMVAQKQAMPTTAEQSTQLAQLRISSERAAQQDQQELSSAAQQSSNGQQLARLGDWAFSQAQWQQAAQLYKQALERGGLKLVAQIQLRRGAALKLAADPAAKDILHAVKGDASAMQLAALWNVWRP